MPKVSVVGKLTLSRSEMPLSLFNGQNVHFLAAKTRVRIDKAKRLLDYRPAFELEQGMDLTEQWAR